MNPATLQLASIPQGATGRAGGSVHALRHRAIIAIRQLVHRRARLSACLLLPLMFAAACTPSSEEREVEFRVPVSVEDVQVMTLEDSIVTTGTLRTPEVVTLNAQDAGVLEINNVTAGRRYAEGDFVEPGVEIARIVGEDVRLATRMSAARRSYEAAETDLIANRDLFQRGLINQTALDTSEKAYEEAKLDYERSRRTEDRNRLVTPIGGVILKLARNEEGQPLANGQLVSPGQLIAQVAPLHPLIADVDLVGRDIAVVSVGLEARARHHAFTGQDFAGRVLRLAPTVDARTRALRAEVEIDNRDFRLRPGMFVEVLLVGERRENVTVVPRRAVADRGGRRVVFVLRGQHVAQQTVELGLGDDEYVEVRAGVEPGDRVVVRGLETLTDQTLVRVTGR